MAIRGDGEVVSRAKAKGYDVSRRSYDLLDPAGRAIFLLDADAEAPRPWMLIGNAPGRAGESPRIERGDDSLVVIGTGDAVRATAEVRLAAPGDAAEVWTITLENLADSARRLKVVPYLEWVLNRPDADRGHTQYNRLFAEVEYVAGLHAVLAWDKHSKAMGVLAADVAPEGFLSARVDFIGRARSLATPRALETLDFFEARDTDAHPTFDPIGSLLLGVTLPARGTAQVRLLIGLAGDKARGDRPDRAAPRHPRRGRDLRRPEAEGVAPDRPRRDPSRHARAVCRVLRRRPQDARPHAVHAPAVRPHDVQRARARRLGDEPRAAYDLQRERPAEPPDPRLVRHRHPRGPLRGDLPLRPGRRASGSRRPITP